MDDAPTDSGTAKQFDVRAGITLNRFAHPFIRCGVCDHIMLNHNIDWTYTDWDNFPSEPCQKCDCPQFQYPDQ